MIVVGNKVKIKGGDDVWTVINQLGLQLKLMNRGGIVVMLEPGYLELIKPVAEFVIPAGVKGGDLLRLNCETGEVTVIR
jgi:hypothetical protein